MQRQKATSRNEAEATRRVRVSHFDSSPGSDFSDSVFSEGAPTYSLPLVVLVRLVQQLAAVRLVLPVRRVGAQRILAGLAAGTLVALARATSSVPSSGPLATPPADWYRLRFRCCPLFHV